MPLADILVECQDFLLGSGDPATLESQVDEQIDLLSRIIPVFGNVQLLYNTWAVGQYIAAASTYADVSSAATGPGDFSVCTTTANDGLLIGAAGPFDRVTFTLTSGHSGTDPQYEWSYWTGWQWTLLPLRQTPDFSAAGSTALTFEPPADWVLAVPTDIVFPESVVQQYFWLRLRATFPPQLAPPQASTLAVSIRFFPLPENVLQLLSVHFFPRELEPAGVAWGMDGLDPAWRTRTGQPVRYTQEIETTRRLRLIPSPNVQGATMGLPPFQGLPGAMVPTNHVITFFLEAPPVERLSDWFEALVAYLLVSWQSAREGELQDLTMSQAMHTLVGMLVALLKDLAHFPGEELLETAWKMPLWESLV